MANEQQPAESNDDIFLGGLRSMEQRATAEREKLKRGGGSLGKVLLWSAFISALGSAAAMYAAIN